MTPAEAGESGEIPIRRDPLASVLDCKRGEPGIGNEIPLGTRFIAKSPEDRPMPWTRPNRDPIGASPEGIREFESFKRWTRGIPHSRMSDDAQKSADNEITQPEGRLAVYDFIEPVTVSRVVGCIFPKGVHEDVDIGENHRRSFIKSSKAAESSMSTPG